MSSFLVIVIKNHSIKRMLNYDDNDEGSQEFFGEFDISEPSYFYKPFLDFLHSMLQP